MTATTVLVRRLPHGNATALPAQATGGAAGFDLQSAEDAVIAPGEIRAIATGMALAIPPGFEGQVRPRSGLALKHGVTVLNSPGTVDSDYRGEVKVILINHGSEPFRIAAGDRIAQMVFATTHQVTFEQVETLPPSDRGTGGFGSTGTSSKPAG